MNGTADQSSPPKAKPKRLRGFFQTVALIALILGGVAALNWPITFAREAATPSGASTAQTLLAQEERSSSASSATVAEIAEKANPAVVTITNYRNQVDPRTNEVIDGAPVAFGIGSGYIIDDAGHVVTNQHVTNLGVAFEVQFFDGTIVNATLVGSDPFQDVAVLQLDLDAGQTVPGTLSFGDSDSVRAGDHVIAIGSPYGEFMNSVSDGSVAALDRSLDTEDGIPLVNLIQHSAPIYEGNSGGPLLNMAGEVVGMNVAKITESSRGLASNDQDGIGFAIESDAITSILNQIIEKGTLARAYLGIESDGRSDDVIVKAVVADGPADLAGVHVGDVITKLDGKSVIASNRFVSMLILNHAPGETVEVSVLRDGQELTLTATLGERPAIV